MASSRVECATEGCEGHVYVEGRNRRDANYRASKMADRRWTCRDCDNREAAEAAVAAGLPTLDGTEKQVAWANGLRNAALSYGDQLLAGAREHGDRPIAGYLESSLIHVLELANKIGLPAVERAYGAMQEETAATFWIDNRGNSCAVNLMAVHRRLVEEDRLMSPEGKALAAAEQDAMVEATMRPPEPVSETVAEISVRGGRMVASYDERSEKFNALVKRFGFRWEPGTGWVRAYDAGTMGLLADRVAETAHELLAAGIVVAVHDPVARAKAIDRSYEPEHTRWIKVRVSGSDAGKFVLTWGRDEDFYRQFRGIRGAAYRDRCCIVPATSRDELLDFAEEHGFRLTAAAQARAAEVLEQRERGTVVAAVARPAPEPVEELRAGPPAALPVPESVEVDSDLVDHD